MEQRLKHLDLWVWRYLENERNYPGLHLTARPESCAMVLDVLATLRAEGGVVDLELTPEYITVFEDGIRDVARGRGDYSIAPPRKRRKNKKLPAKDRVSLYLWFWPCFGHLAPVP